MANDRDVPLIANESGAAFDGMDKQIENAMEIGLEHNLGLTYDPVGGLVQISGIERKATGAVKAINTVYVTRQRDSRDIVSLGAVIEPMRQTDNDMRPKYKETSLCGTTGIAEPCIEIG